MGSESQLVSTERLSAYLDNELSVEESRYIENVIRDSRLDREMFERLKIAKYATDALINKLSSDDGYHRLASFIKNWEPAPSVDVDLEMLFRMFPDRSRLRDIMQRLADRLSMDGLDFLESSAADMSMMSLSEVPAAQISKPSRQPGFDWGGASRLIEEHRSVIDLLSQVDKQQSELFNDCCMHIRYLSDDPNSAYERKFGRSVLSDLHRVAEHGYPLAPLVIKTISGRKPTASDYKQCLLGVVEYIVKKGE